MSMLSKLGGSVKKAVTNPVKWAENVGRTIGKANKDAAPFAGMIPGVGPGIGAAMGGIGDIMAGGNMKSHVTSALKGGLSGLGNQLMGGEGITGLIDKAGGVGDGSFLGKVGGVLKTGAKQVGSNFMKPDGSLDLGKVIAAGGSASNLIGQAKQRKSATNYNNAQIDQRNELMSKILAPSNYNLPTITPNQGGY